MLAGYLGNSCYDYLIFAGHLHPQLLAYLAGNNSVLYQPPWLSEARLVARIYQAHL